MTIRKRLLAIMMTLVLCFGMLPTNVSAANVLMITTGSTPYYYTFQNVGTGKYLKVTSNSSSNNANISVTSKDSSAGENFAIYASGSNYILVPECSTSRAVSVASSTISNKTNVCMKTNTSSSTQQWKLKAVSGGYVIQCASNTNYVLTATGSSNGSNVNIQKYSSSNKNQIWKLTASTAAIDSVTISATLSPTTIVLGNTLGLTGTVTSASSNLSSVNAEIYNSSGKLMGYASKTSVNAKTFSLSKLPTLSTKNLSVGTYTLKITAINKNSKKATWTKTFTVTDNVTINVTSYATSRKVGNTSKIGGTVTSQSSNITSVTMTILNSSKKQYSNYSWSVKNINSKSYNLSKLASSLYGSLPAGTYYYQLTATNASGQTSTWTKKFTVTK